MSEELHDQCNACNYWYPEKEIKNGRCEVCRDMGRTK